MLTLPTNDPLVIAYRNALGRNPDAAGYAYWRNQMNSGMSVDDITGYLSSSAEGQGTAAAPDPTQLVNVGSEFSAPADGPVNQHYQNELGRDADLDGWAFYYDGFANQGWDQDTIRNDLSQWAANNPQPTTPTNPQPTNPQPTTPTNPQPTNPSNPTARPSNPWSPTAQTNTDAGFAATNQNLVDGFVATNENLGTGFATLNDNIGTGLQDTNTNIINTGQTILDNQGQMHDNIINGQTQNTETILGGQEALNTTLTDASSAITSGQQGIASQLTTASNNLAQYYADLMQGQQGIGSDISSFAGDFSDYRGQYDTDVIAATNARTQTQDMLQGGVDSIRKDVGTAASAQQQGQASLMDAVGSASMGITSSNGFAGSAPNPAAPPPPQNPAQGSIAQGVSSIRQNLPALLDRVSPQLQKSYVSLVGSFDEQGGLIPTSTDAQGNVLQRSLDRSGVLSLRGLDPTGNILGEERLSVPQMFQIASQAMQGTGNGFMG